MNGTLREKIIGDYTEAVGKCAEILSAVDKKYGTYGAIEVKDINVTQLGSPIRQYIRGLEWREIRIQ